MEKVKITQEQEVGINSIKESLQSNLKDLKNNPTHYKLEERALAELTIDEIERALYIGYEVVGNFGLGDCLYDEVEKKVFRAITQGQVDSINNHPENFRYATKQEIWWFENGRCVWELKENDALYDRELNEIVTVSHDYILRKEIQSNYKVACFAEDRKDI